MKYFIMKNYRMKIASIIFLLSFIGFIRSESSGGYAGAFLELPPMASSVAFGGACLTFDPEPAALFWNPANLSNLNKFNAQVSIEGLPYDATRSGIAMSIPIKRRYRLAFGILSHSISDIQGRDMMGNPTDMLDFGYTSFNIGGSYGISSRKNIARKCDAKLWRFSAGMSLKMISQNDDDDFYDGSGVGIDMGLSGRYRYFSYGVLIRNILGEIDWSNSEYFTLPAALIAGVGFDYCESHWVELSVESKVSGRLRWRLGGQGMVKEWAGFRAGIDFTTGSPSAVDEIRAGGGGVIYYKLGIPLELSYSLQYIAAIHRWAFSSSLSFNTFTPE